jgi:hypothetical protein
MVLRRPGAPDLRNVRNVRNVRNMRKTRDMCNMRDMLILRFRASMYRSGMPAPPRPRG